MLGWYGRSILVLAGCAGTAVSGVGRGVNAAQAVTEPSLVFEGVTVVDVEQGELAPNQRVVIAGNRIQTVGPSSTVLLPPGARVVDAWSKYLIPGLWDLHVHPLRLTEIFYPLLLANGVTGIRDAGSPVPLDTLRQWRREILTGSRVGPPRQLLSGGVIADCHKRTAPAWYLCTTDSAEARRLVDSLKTAGADMIKPRFASHLRRPDVRRAMYFVVAAEARRVGIPFGGHGEFHVGEVTAIESADSGATLLDHSVGTRTCWLPPQWVPKYGVRDFEHCRESAQYLRGTGLWFVPSLIAHKAMRGGGHADTTIEAHLKKRAGEFWAGSLLHGNWLRDALHASRDSSDIMGIAERLGLQIVAGTDAIAFPAQLRQAPAGLYLHAELATYVATGMTPLAALQTATLNPAKMWHGTDSLGTVAPGKLADLVLLDADPLADITNTTTIRAVVANGRYYDRAALDGLLAKVQAEAGQP